MNVGSSPGYREPASGAVVPSEVVQVPTSPGVPNVPPAAEMPTAPPPSKGSQLPIPKSWWIGFLVILAGVGAASWYLSQNGTSREIDALVAFSNILIAVAALFSIYLSARGRGASQQ
jgi:hypothetical protein